MKRPLRRMHVHALAVALAASGCGLRHDVSDVLALKAGWGELVSVDEASARRFVPLAAAACEWEPKTIAGAAQTVFAFEVPRGFQGPVLLSRVEVRAVDTTHALVTVYAMYSGRGIALDANDFLSAAARRFHTELQLLAARSEVGGSHAN